MQGTTSLKIIISELFLDVCFDSLFYMPMRANRQMPARHNNDNTKSLQLKVPSVGLNVAGNSAFENVIQLVAY